MNDIKEKLQKLNKEYCLKSDNLEKEYKNDIKKLFKESKLKNILKILNINDAKIEIRSYNNYDNDLLITFIITKLKTDGIRFTLRVSETNCYIHTNSDCQINKDTYIKIFKKLGFNDNLIFN